MKPWQSEGHCVGLCGAAHILRAQKGAGGQSDSERNDKVRPLTWRTVMKVMGMTGPPTVPRNRGTTWMGVQRCWCCTLTTCQSWTAVNSAAGCSFFKNYPHLSALFRATLLFLLFLPILCWKNVKRIFKNHHPWLKRKLRTNNYKKIKKPNTCTVHTENHYHTLAKHAGHS